MNLIKKYFVTNISEERGISVAGKDGKTMLMATPEFKFLDVMNYVAPGTSYNIWVKTYGPKQTKARFPYEWFESAEKLHHIGLPPYRVWFSKLKNEFVLFPEEYNQCRKLFEQRGMQTFADWLEYYNNLNVVSFLQAPEVMWDSYTELGIDIFRDAVSLPGVSLK